MKHREISVSNSHTFLFPNRAAIYQQYIEISSSLGLVRQWKQTVFRTPKRIILDTPACSRATPGIELKMLSEKLFFFILS